MVTENAEAEAAQMATTAAVNFMVEVEVEVNKLLIRSNSLELQIVGEYV